MQSYSSPRSRMKDSPKEFLQLNSRENSIQQGTTTINHLQRKWNHQRRNIRLIHINPFDRIQIPIARKLIMTSRILSIRFSNPRPPSNQWSPRIIRMSIAMTPPITHSMVRGEHPRRRIVLVKVIHQFDCGLDSLVDDFDVVEVFFGVRSVSVACGIESQ